MPVTFSVSPVSPERRTHEVSEQRNVFERLAFGESLREPQRIEPLRDPEVVHVVGVDAIEQSSSPPPPRVLAIEAMSPLPAPLLTFQCQPLLGVCRLAFAKHLPLTLSPDHVWLCILQGVATHVQKDPEACRRFFVQHEGTLTLEVRRDDFIKGDPRNPWPEVFEAFSDEIHAHLGVRHDLLRPDFSTTDAVARAACDVAMMDVVSSYFEYSMVTLCGIPSITLEGAREDWVALSERVRVFGELGLQWWTEPLYEALGAFVSAFDGDHPEALWSSFFKKYSVSGGPDVTGWVNVLFPFQTDGTRNPVCVPVERMLATIAETPQGPFASPSLGAMERDYPLGLSQVDFNWQHISTHHAMVWTAGFIGASQQEDGAVRPEQGWCVAERL